MIQKIRHRFIRIAVLALTLAMVLVTVVINTVNWANARAELQETLIYLAQNGGRPARDGRGKGNRGRGFQNRLDEARFFSVYADDSGAVSMNDASRLDDYSADELAALAGQVLSSGRSDGFWGDYLFLVTRTPSGGRFAVFLNCETRLGALRRLALFSAAACAGGVLLAWLLVALFSRRAIQPLIDNAVRQKQFITDAGHELKTPLTVISRSTRAQLANLRTLVGELIDLSRLDEEGFEPQLRALDLAALLRDVAAPFEGMAEFSGKSLTVDAPGALTMEGDEALLRRLISVLCENAVKYAPEGDAIAATLRDDGRRAVLSVENGLAEPLSKEALERLFDRFYRADASRSRESGGYGIGLSVARAIVERHGGDIRALQTDAGRLRFVATLPKNGGARKRRPATM